MTVDENLAGGSNLLLYSAMAVYAVALVAYAVDLSGARHRGRDTDGWVRPAVPEATAAPARAVARVGASAAPPFAPDPSVLAAPARVPGGGSRGSGEGAGDGRDGSRVAVRRGARVGVSLTVLAFALHAVAVLLRGLSAHRVPWGNMYEFAATGAMVVSGVFLGVLVWQRRPRSGGRDLRYLGLFVVGPVLLTLGLALTVLYTASAQLVPALQSYWLVIHVSVAFTAAALFTIGFSLTVLQLVQDRREGRRARGAVPGGRFMDALPTCAELERTAARVQAVAFVLWTFTLVAGAIWAQAAWGRFWNWDPKEVWTFVIWVVYAGYLHARATRGWDGRRAAWLAGAGYACILVNFLVVNIFLVGRHSYAGVG